VTSAYIDASVPLRIALGEPDPLAEFAALVPISSALLRVECLRAIERYRLMGAFGDDVVAERRSVLMRLASGFRLVDVTSGILDRAADPFPVHVATLDALHLATAMELRLEVEDLSFATHDAKLASAARAVGFEVLGV